MGCWRSIAIWDSSHGFLDNMTIDEHGTRDEAESVCRMLERDGLGGDCIHYPISTRVEKKVEDVWLFTFGYGHEFPNRFVRVEGSYGEARLKMFKMYGDRWAFQYPLSDESHLIEHGVTEMALPRF